jgi:hypothetical protein
MHKTLTYTAVRIATPWPWVLLVGRSGLFVAMQALVALIFYWRGEAGAWEAAAAWWPLGVTAANLLCLAALVWLFRAEGGSYWSLFRIRREDVKADWLPLLGLLVITGPVGFLPNVLLSNWLYGGLEAAVALVVRPLPVWAAYAGLVLFPVTQGLVELALYFLYVMPRLEAQGAGRWAALTLAGLGLGLQHAAIPLLFDGRYLLWRGLMFVPFALLMAFILRWRPRLLPYMAVVHVLMDLSFAAMLLGVAY